MRIEYLCHSCLYIETEDTSLVTDPWIKGGAYMNQWQLFPKPVDIAMLRNVKNILFSHGHEDHLHSESLGMLPMDARIYFPFQWRKGVKTFLKEMGFNHVTEAVSFKSYHLSKDTSISFVGFALESVIIIEHKGKVIVNINDALNSHHENVVKMFLSEIKKRWEHIDYLFSGWSGAGYFPNTVHFKGKDDIEVAKIREQYFANNFCKSIQYLQPDYAIPFASGFVLLANDKQWINDIKFPRELLEEYYKKYFDANTKIKFCIMNPGDYFNDEGFHAVSPYYNEMKNGSLNHLIETIYSEEIKEANKISFINRMEADILQEKILIFINQNKKLFDSSVLAEAKFAVLLKDLETPLYFNLDYENNKFIISNSKEMKADRKLLIRTDSKLLSHSISHDWGGDVLTIGYGIDVDVFDEKALEQNLDIVCVRLLTKYPTAKESLNKHPLRAMGYFLRHPMMGKLALKQKMKLRNEVNKFPYNERDHWINFTKCELCMVCNLPLFSFEFGESLKELEITN